MDKELYLKPQANIELLSNGSVIETSNEGWELPVDPAWSRT